MVDVDGKRYLTSSVRGFDGQIACNETASYILRKLKHRTSEKAIVKAMRRVYDVPQDEIEADVRQVLQSLRRIGALEE
jgi:hypothetical protein